MEFVAVALIAAFAAFVQSSVGFGYALVFAPIASFLIAPSEAIAVSIASSTVINTLLYAEYRPRTDIKAVAALTAASVLATPIGLYALLVADEDLLRLFIASGVFLSAAVNLRHPSREGPPRPDRIVLQLIVGALAGAIRGAVSMGGPPVILYQHWI
ncbi:MAG: sulfite exporter TauE/SafE family protein, partial [Dehalococcoidia bacterium]|nr:sulfite exporter TauE/SafE family protein [Dehalococcoidia bacterium]